jgi:hypothetical protein
VPAPGQLADHDTGNSAERSVPTEVCDILPVQEVAIISLVQEWTYVATAAARDIVQRRVEKPPQLISPLLRIHIENQLDGGSCGGSKRIATMVVANEGGKF